MLNVSLFKKTFFVLAFALVASFFFTPRLALAQCDIDANDPLGVKCGAASKLGNTDIRLTVARIIYVSLGLLGTVSLVLILYAGFSWMTAGGNEEKIETAKGTLWAAVIGLIIILSAYALTNFIITQLYRATTNTHTLYP